MMIFGGKEEGNSEDAQVSGLGERELFPEVGIQTRVGLGGQGAGDKSVTP